MSGFAHYGQGPAQDGLALSAPTGRIHFIEVLQSEYLATRVWYELLDMGFRVAPSAGTDWPCIPSLPGRERVYVGIEGELTRDAYVAGLRAGRTFVTNGPVLALRADDVEIGGELSLDAPRDVRIEGSVRFDPERDHVSALELVVGGRVARFEDEPAEPGVLRIEAEIPIEHTTWIALRSLGEKLDEIPHVAEHVPPEWAEGLLDRWGGGWSFEGRYEFLAKLDHRPSLAHTAAIHVTVPGRPSPDAPAAARSWLARLDDLEARLSDERIDEIRALDRLPYSDAVSVEHVRRHRPALREAIARARARFESVRDGGAALARGDGSSGGHATGALAARDTAP